MRSWGERPPAGISALVREDTRKLAHSPPSSSPMWGHGGKSAACKPGGELTEPGHAGTPVSDFRPQTCEKAHSCCLSHQVYDGALLQQPELRKTLAMHLKAKKPTNKKQTQLFHALWNKPWALSTSSNTDADKKFFLRNILVNPKATLFCTLFRIKSTSNPPQCL